MRLSDSQPRHRIDLIFSPTRYARITDTSTRFIISLCPPFSISISSSPHLSPIPFPHTSYLWKLYFAAIVPLIACTPPTTTNPYPAICLMATIPTHCDTVIPLISNPSFKLMTLGSLCRRLCYMILLASELSMHLPSIFFSSPSAFSLASPD